MKILWITFAACWHTKDSWKLWMVFLNFIPLTNLDFPLLWILWFTRNFVAVTRSFSEISQTISWERYKFRLSISSKTLVAVSTYCIGWTYWLIPDLTWVKVFKNGLSRTCGRQPLKNLKWYDLPYITSIFLKAAFHKFYLVYSWIPSRIYI